MSTTSPASLTSTKPLFFMVKLGPLVSIYRPSVTAGTRAGHQPRLIIFSSWTDAKDAQVAKYIVKYKSLYPAASILHLRSTSDTMVRPSQIGPAMKVAASVIRAEYQTQVSSSSLPLLIHMFSGGGGSNIANLYEQYASTAGPNDDKRLPPHVTIFDSCPGLFRIPRAAAFVGAGVPFPQRLIAAPFLYALATSWTVLISLGLLPDSLSDWYKSHNHDVGNTSEVRRVYIYSAADAVMDYRDVEAHAAEAKTKGFSVELEKYEGSAHVAHLLKDEDRYWSIVTRLVESFNANVAKL